MDLLQPNPDGVGVVEEKANDTLKNPGMVPGRQLNLMFEADGSAGPAPGDLEDAVTALAQRFQCGQRISASRAQSMAGTEVLPETVPQG